MEPVTTVSGTVAVLDRSDIDTDQIIPKQFLKRIERTGFGEFLFYDWVRSGEIDLSPAPILVAGRNFGSGSSREHAVWALQQFGFDAIVAPSFADIFFNNATKNGLLPVVIEPDHVQELMTCSKATIDLDALTVTFGGRSVSFSIDPEIRKRLLNGLDDIAITLESVGAIDAYEAAGRDDAAPVTTEL